MFNAIADKNLDKLLRELSRAGFSASDGSFRNDLTPSANVDIPGSSEYIKVWVPDNDESFSYAVAFDELDEYFDAREVATIPQVLDLLDDIIMDYEDSIGWKA